MMNNAITVSHEVVTPEKATVWLTINSSNRPQRQAVIKRYARDMAAENWRPGGATIDFDINGRLMNGQHRLAACILANTPFQAVIVRGLPPESQTTMDTGLKRSLTDILTWKGETNVANLSAAINLGYRWLHADGGIPDRRVVPTFDESLEWLENNPGIRHRLLDVQPVKARLGLPLSILAIAVHQFHLIDSGSATAFVTALARGENLTENDPILNLRNWTVNQILHRGQQRGNPDQTLYLALILKTWNYWLTGTTVSNLRWRRGGASKEPFPVATDLDGMPWKVRDEHV